MVEGMHMLHVYVKPVIIYQVMCNYAIFTFHVILIILYIHFEPPDSERGVAQWLERGALPMSLPAVRFRIPLGATFSDKYYISPLSILGHYFDAVSLGKALYPHMLHLTQV